MKPSGYPLPLSQANKLGAFSPPHSNATHMPTSWQGISTPTMPPRKWERRVSWSHSGGRRTTGGLAMAEIFGIPPGRDKEGQTPVLGIQTQATDPGTVMPTLKAPTLVPRPCHLLRARLQMQLAESMPRNSCHKSTTSACVPAECQPLAKGHQDDCSRAHQDHSWVSLSPEVPSKPRDTNRGKLPLVRGCWGQQLAPCLPAGGRLKCPV